MKLSVLDLITVRSGQSTAHALAASVALAQRADELGYHRYWVAEHHNMPSVASTSPPVAIAMLAARTKRIRLGSGGVMLPNHSPLIVAEQFALLEAFAPGRIDLGIGRAPGSDPVVSAVLSASGRRGQVDTFAQDVETLGALMSPEGAAVRLGTGEEYPLRATPAAAGVPQIWLLGSSDYSAQLAASLGLPYVFASHFFAGAGTDQALQLYRSRFEPSQTLAEPRVLITLNAVVAESRDEAMELALPNLHQMARLRTGGRLSAVETVEQAAATPATAREQQVIDEMAGAWIIDDPQTASDRLHAMAAAFGADEVMVSHVAGARDADPLHRYPARERTLELLAKWAVKP